MLFTKIRAFLRNIFSSRGVDADLDQEVHSHLAMLTDENLRSGMSQSEAQRAARIELGGIEQLKEQVRDQRLGNWLNSVLADCRFALRQLRKSPAFTAVAILTLALGIGSTTAMFSIVNTALLRPLSYREPQQLYLVHEIVPQMAKFYPILDANLPDFRIWQKQVHSFEDVAIAESTTATSTGQGQPEVLHGIRASANIFSVLGARPVLGRNFLPEEDDSGRGRVLILTDAFWRTRFRGDAAAIGTTMTLDGVPHQIVGILPASFRFPSALGSDDAYPIAYFRPLNGPLEYEQGLIGEFDFHAVARLRTGVTQQQALAELNVVQSQIARQANEGVDLLGDLQPLEAKVIGPARRGLLFLLGAVVAVLLIVCANLASLLIARVPARMREAAIRAALGASHARIVRQMLTEAILLSFAGGALGIASAYFALNWLVHLAPPGIPRLDEVHIDARVLLFSLIISIATGALFGIFPALRAARSEPVDALKSVATATTESRRTRRLRGGLVGFEVGLTTLLLVLAGLLIASLGQLLHVHTGFVSENALIASIDLPPQTYSQPATRLHFYDRVLAGLQSLPGIRAAGWVSIPPLGGEGSVTGITIPGAQSHAETPMANYRPASPDYFAAMGIPLLQGRIFGPADRGRKIVVVSQSVAERFWPGKNPIGQTCITEWGPDLPAEVIAVVGDIRTVQLDEPPLMMVYVPDWFNTISVPTSAAIVLRATGDPATYAGPVRDLIHHIDADVPITTLPMSEIVDHSVDPRRFPLFLASSFALVSLLLASLGIFGVVAYSVEQRRHELGIRMALGADLQDLLRMVLRQGMAPVLIGLAAGVVAAILGGQLISSLLFGVSAHDPLTFVTVALVIAIVAFAACYIPARRATHVDPMTALRYE
ncbi:MAG TPA: ABC transporter permease [Candidatus Eremiobacteraceae bacterium]|nr:ABC transporter permease [Candidatus Eremiobacteraceae bacterium]